MQGRHSMRFVVFVRFCGFLTAAALISGCGGYASRPYPQGEDPSKGTSTAAEPGAEWSMNATIIEACSCPMFCQCYFASKPAAHGPGCHMGGEPGTYCKFNNAYRVNRGYHQNVKLDGAKFW